MIHLEASTYCAAAVPAAGVAVVRRDRDKSRQYVCSGTTGYWFVPLLIETYGHLGTLLMELLHQVGAFAAAHGEGLVTQQQFVQEVLRELSMCLCRYNARL
jgi:hypothetical protein